MRPMTSTGCHHREDRHAEGARQDGRESRSDIGDKPQDGREKAPQEGIGDADQEEPEPHSDSSVDDRLHQQVAADALTGLIERLRRRRQLAEARQPDQPIAQVALFEEHEDDQHQHQPGARQGSSSAGNCQNTEGACTTTGTGCAGSVPGGPPGRGRVACSG